MPIGSIQIYETNNQSSSLKRFFKKLYLRIYGTSDLHTHIRWRAIKRLIDFRALSVLDIGCGYGLITLELSLTNPEMKIVGTDADKKAVIYANSLKENMQLQNIEFCHHDAMASHTFRDNMFDMVLLIDVIEHIQVPEIVIENVSRVLKPGGSVVISVPTPNYPKFFGHEFHKEIGHVVDGYWCEDVEEMLNRYGIYVTEYNYYTYYPSSLVCALFYRWLRKSRVGVLMSPFLNFVSYLDAIWPIRRPKFACSLAMKAEKVK